MTGGCFIFYYFSILPRCLILNVLFFSKNKDLDRILNLKKNTLRCLRKQCLETALKVKNKQQQPKI